MISIKDFFGLRCSPFTKNVSGEQIFQYQQLDQLFSVLNATVEDSSMALITGRAGVGKTTAVRGFLDNLSSSQYKIIYLGQDQRGVGVLNRLSTQLGIRLNWTWNKRVLQISQRLEQLSCTHKIVLVIDEAHLLDQTTLEDFRLLTNQDIDRRSPVSILLLGQHWLRGVLKTQGFEALYQRLRLRYSLEGLTEEETVQYIKHHMVIAGSQRDVFEKKALARIFSASEGILREINNIAFEALMRAASTNQQTVDEKIVRWVFNQREVS